jgi:hypothetical protein
MAKRFSREALRANIQGVSLRPSEGTSSAFFDALDRYTPGNYSPAPSAYYGNPEEGEGEYEDSGAPDEEPGKYYAEFGDSTAVPLTLIPTQSSFPNRPRTLAAGWAPYRDEPESGTLTVAFRDGTLWNFYDVGESVWIRFKSAMSKGKDYLNDPDGELVSNYTHERADGVLSAQVTNMVSMAQSYRGPRNYVQAVTKKPNASKQNKSALGPRQKRKKKP